MKIFSLQTKKHLVGWSVGFGVVLDVIAFFLTFERNTLYCGAQTSYVWDCAPYIDSGGFPFSYDLVFMGSKHNSFLQVTDLFFWILISAIFLSIIRYFKYRTSKS